jgi:hypothetical protein
MYASHCEEKSHSKGAAAVVELSNRRTPLAYLLLSIGPIEVSSGNVDPATKRERALITTSESEIP